MEHKRSASKAVNTTNSHRTNRTKRKKKRGHRAPTNYLTDKSDQSEHSISTIAKRGHRAPTNYLTDKSDQSEPSTSTRTKLKTQGTRYEEEERERLRNSKIEITPSKSFTVIQDQRPNHRRRRRRTKLETNGARREEEQSQGLAETSRPKRKLKKKRRKRTNSKQTVQLNLEHTTRSNRTHRTNRSRRRRKSRNRKIKRESSVIGGPKENAGRGSLGNTLYRIRSMQPKKLFPLFMYSPASTPGPKEEKLKSFPATHETDSLSTDEQSCSMELQLEKYLNAPAAKQHVIHGLPVPNLQEIKRNQEVEAKKFEPLVTKGNQGRPRNTNLASSVRWMGSLFARKSRKSKL